MPERRRRARNSSTVPVQRVLTAGGIIFRKRNGIIEFFFIRDGYGKWTFPKGKVALGETLAETAIREIREETGLTNLRYIAPLGRTSFRFRRGTVVYEKTIHHFLFEAPADAQEKLQGTEGISKAGWFPIEKAKTVSSYKNLERLFSRALQLTTEQGKI